MTKATDANRVRRANVLARLFYLGHGYQVQVGYRFDQAKHPQEQLMWRNACLAFEYLGSGDPQAAVDRLKAMETPPTNAEGR